MQRAMCDHQRLLIQYRWCAVFASKKQWEHAGVCKCTMLLVCVKQQFELYTQLCSKCGKFGFHTGLVTADLTNLMDTRSTYHCISMAGHMHGVATVTSTAGVSHEQESSLRS